MRLTFSASRERYTIFNDFQWRVEESIKRAKSTNPVPVLNPPRATRPPKGAGATFEGLYDPKLVRMAFATETCPADEPIESAPFMFVRQSGAVEIQLKVGPEPHPGFLGHGIEAGLFCREDQGLKDRSLIVSRSR